MEALGSFELVLTHRDGRKLLSNNSPGEIVKPMMWGFDLLQDKEGNMEWEVMDDCDCPNIAGRMLCARRTITVYAEIKRTYKALS